ncbi:MAG: acetyl-CoA C-acyltransferase [Pirellulaceae bacterium]|nr:acetyl-CoA C-acyltransferase [Pirellulaceae bacterium]
MDNPVVLSAQRTPIGKFFGSLSQVAVPDLGAAVIRSAIEVAGVDAGQVDEVILGNVLAAGVGQAPARQAALAAELPHTVAAVTINKMCGSGLKAIMLAAQSIRSGDTDLVVAGGMESMSRAPFLLPRKDAKLGDRTLVDSMLHDGLICPFTSRGMGAIADQLAKSDQIRREQQDRYASMSHQRAITAADKGEFDREIVPVATGDGLIDCDEGPRSDSTPSALANLRPAFDRDGSVTAGNASMISDGAAAVVVASPQFAAKHGLRPIAEIVASATSGTAPEDLFIAPVTAIENVLRRAKLKLSDIDLIELNEAFAAQMIACQQRLNLDEQRMNVRGGAIALGHPIGASGARVLTTLLHSMIDHDKSFGLASLCLGGGNAVAMIVRKC